MKVGSVSGEAVQDYLSYTVKIGQLAQRFDWLSVLLYDREYRALQATHNFRWGSDAPHLHTVMLRPRSLYHSPFSSGYSRPKFFNANPNGTHSNQEREPAICRQFNSPRGCHFTHCKFAHVCNIKGCGKQHAAIDHPGHGQVKN